jgi:CheY-like chemotaxis protein
MTLSIMNPTPAEDRPGDGPLVLLVSPDLLSTSRIAGLAREAGGRLETLRSLDDPLPGGPYDLVLLDLQAVNGDPAVLVARTLAMMEPQRTQTGKAARLVAFGPHVAKERLDQAKAAGADAAVSRGELLGGFPAIVKRWCS